MCVRAVCPVSVKVVSVLALMPYVRCRVQECVKGSMGYKREDMSLPLGISRIASFNIE